MPPRREFVASVAAIAVGGAAGALTRFEIGQLWPDDQLAAGGFPWTTLCINASGCLVLGALVAMLDRLTSPHPLVRPLIGTGFLGGFTTFSTQAAQAQQLIVDGHGWVALRYLAATLAVGLIAIRIGMLAIRSMGLERKRP